MTKRIALIIVFAVVALTAATTASALPPWSPGFTWHIAPVPHSRLVYIRQLGTATDQVDDTTPITYADLGGNQETEHVAAWKNLDLSRYVPKNAKVALLSIKTIITKPYEIGTADVFVFMRSSGSTCCRGPAGFADYPVDFSTTTNPDHLGIAAQAVLGQLGGVRQFDTIAIPLKNGRMQIAWGYQRMPSDALAFAVYLDGYGS
jgi:hypothetical protein